MRGLGPLGSRSSIPRTIPRACGGPCLLAETPQRRGLQNRNARFDSWVPRSLEARKMRASGALEPARGLTLRSVLSQEIGMDPLNDSRTRDFGPYDGP
jgi:hypothetical protein